MTQQGRHPEWPKGRSPHSHLHRRPHLRWSSRSRHCGPCVSKTWSYAASSPPYLFYPSVAAPPACELPPSLSRFSVGERGRSAAPEKRFGERREGIGGCKTDEKKEKGKSGIGRTREFHEARLGTQPRATWDREDVWDDSPVCTFENFHGIREPPSNILVAGGGALSRVPFDGAPAVILKSGSRLAVRGATPSEGSSRSRLLV